MFYKVSTSVSFHPSLVLMQWKSKSSSIQTWSLLHGINSKSEYLWVSYSKGVSISPEVFSHLSCWLWCPVILIFPVAHHTGFLTTPTVTVPGGMCPHSQTLTYILTHRHSCFHTHTCIHPCLRIHIHWYSCRYKLTYSYTYPRAKANYCNPIDPSLFLKYFLFKFFSSLCTSVHIVLLHLFLFKFSLFFKA